MLNKNMVRMQDIDEELRLAGLTSKEMEVYKLWKAGKRVTEISRILGKKPSTVSILLKKAKRKDESYRQLKKRIMSTFEERLKEIEDRLVQAETLAIIAWSEAVKRSKG